MKAPRSVCVASRRVKTACIILVISIVLLLILSAISRSLSSPVFHEAMNLDSLNDAFTLKEKSQFGDSEETKLPSGFEEELLSLSNKEELRTHILKEGGGLVGFSVSTTAENTMTVIVEEMIKKGWSATDSKWGEATSFFKENGRYQWAFVSCVQTGDTTSVVVQYKVYENKKED